MKTLGLVDGDFVLLPGNKTKIEGMFTKEEKGALYQLAFGELNENVSKNEFLATMRALYPARETHAKAVAKILSQATKEKFESVLGALKAA